MIFDLTDIHTFDRIEKYWIEQIKEKSDDNCVKILVGNKADCKQVKRGIFRKGRLSLNRDKG